MFELNYRKGCIKKRVYFTVNRSKLDRYKAFFIKKFATL